MGGETVTLDSLKIGQAAKILELHTEGAERRRLLDLGLVPGTVVRAVLRSPLGDPTAYQVRGATIALRKDQARSIFVRTLEEE